MSPMNELVWYGAGILTLPIALAFLGLLVVMFSRRESVWCDNCGKTMGLAGETPWIVHQARWKYHYLRYWYRTRPEWSCAQNEGWPHE